MKVNINRTIVMVLTAMVLAVMSETIFVLGAKTIWSGSIFVVMLFAVIGLAKYQLVASAFDRKNSLFSMVLVLTPLVIISFITHLSFFTDLSNRGNINKSNISNELTTANQAYNILKSQKQGLLEELKQLDIVINSIPKKYVTKRLKIAQSQRIIRDNIRLKVSELDNRLLNQLDHKLEKTKANTVVSKSSLSTLATIIGMSVNKLTQVLNIIVSAIIDIFSLYMAYTVGRVSSEYLQVKVAKEPPTEELVKPLEEPSTEELVKSLEEPSTEELVKVKESLPDKIKEEPSTEELVKENGTRKRKSKLDKFRKTHKIKNNKDKKGLLKGVEESESASVPTLKKWSETLYTDGEK